MHGDVEVAAARTEAMNRAPATLDEVVIETLRADAAELFDQMPEPPAYRRVEDATRARAQELCRRGAAILARALSLKTATRGEARVAVLCEAIEAHVRALAAMGHGDIGGGETLWREAREIARGSTHQGQMWRAAARPRPGKVFDRATGESRYDPRPEPVVTVQLACPNACRKVGTYGVSPRYATHGLVCSNCHQGFTAYFAEARSVETSPAGAALHYALRVEEAGGGERRIEFDDASGADLGVAPRDLVVFLYGLHGGLSATMNLSSGRVLFVVQPGACFVATAVYGPDAPQTRALRAFRDRRLAPSRAGRAAIAAYYRISPGVARLAGRSARVAAVVRLLLDVVVRRLPE